MARKVYIDVVVDDKGTTKRLAVDAKNLSKSLEGAGKSSRTADRSLKGAAQASSNSTKNFSKMAQGITGGLVPAYAVLAANVFAITAAFNFLKNAADFRNLQESQAAFAASTGTNLTIITRELQNASGGMLQFQQAAQAAAIGAAKGFSGDQLTGLVEGARKASVSLGRSFEDTFDRLVRGISKAEPELLDELGITLRLAEATENYGQKIGKAADQLTTYERSLAVLEETTRQLDENFGAIDVDKITNPFVQLQKTFDDIVKVATQTVLPVFEAFADIINRSTGAAIAVFGALGVSIAKAALPIEDVKNAFDSFEEKSRTSFENVMGDVDALKGKVKALKTTAEDLQVEAAITVQDESQGFVSRGTRSKLLAKAADDPFNLTKKDISTLNRSLAAAEKQYKEHGKIVSGIFAGEDIKRVRSFNKSLQDMQKTSISIFTRIGLEIKKIGPISKGVFTGVRVAGIGAFRAIGKVASGVGKVASKALGAAGIFGVFVFLYETVQELRANIFDLLVSILRGVDKVLNFIGSTNIGKTIFAGIETAINAVKTAFASFLGFFSNALRNIAKGASALGAAGVGEKVAAAADYIDAFAEKSTGTLDSFAAATNRAANAQSDLAGSFAASEVGRAAAAYQKGVRTTRQLEEDAEAATQAIEALNESLENAAVKLAEIQKNSPLSEFDEFMRGQRATATSGFAALLQPFAKDTDNITQEVLTKLNTAFTRLKELGSEELSAIFTEFGGITADNIGLVAARLLEAEQAAQKNVGTFKGLQESLKGFQDELRGGIIVSDDITDLQRAEKQFKLLTNDIKALEAAAQAEGLKPENFFLDKFGMSAEAFNEQLQLAITRLNQVAELNQRLGTFEAGIQNLTGGSREQAQEQLRLAKAQQAVFNARARIETLQNAITSKTLGAQGEQAARSEIERLTQQLPVLEAQAKEVALNISDIGKIGQAAGQALSTSFASAFQGLAQGTLTVKQAFGNMATSILQALSDVITQMLVLRTLQAAFGGTSFGSFLGIAAPTATAAPLPATSPGLGQLPFGRYGGIMQGYATGGIARGRNAGYPAILHGTEAVVPLPNGNAIPVEMRNGGTGTNNVTVNVAIDQNGNAQSNTQMDNQQAGQLGKLVSAAVQEELQRQKRPGGILSPYGAA